jgi:F5/8 type C domain-containing protein
MDTGAMRSLMDTAAFQALRDRYAGKGRVIAAIVIAGWVVLAGVGMFLAFGLRSEGDSATASANPTARPTHPATAPGSKAGTKVTSPATVGTLPVAKVIAWGPTGASTAEHPEQAARAVDASAATAWHSKWYMKPAFPGVGLVLDMGKTVTVTEIKLKLAQGDADFLIRVGNTAKPGTLTKVAARSHTGGDVTIKLAKPSRGRYVELWITRLPRDSSGTYQESVYNVQVTGLA